MVGLVTPGGKLLSSKTVPTPVSEGALAAVDAAYELYKELLAEAGVTESAVDRVGAAVPGLADRARGLLRHAPYAGWRDVPIAHMISERFRLPATIANDVNGAAVAELRFGAGQQVNDFIWITWSTGIGGAIIANGQLYEGSSGIAGEFGHLVVAEEGPKCGCGNRGCLEAIAAGAAIGRRAEAVLKGNTFGDTLSKPITAATVADAARTGNEAAIRIMEEAATALARGIAMCVNVLNPKLVVIGGGVARSLDLVLNRMQSIVAERVIGAENKMVPLVPSQLGYNASLLGAAAITL